VRAARRGKPGDEQTKADQSTHADGPAGAMATRR
jgi:hypothetical protein